ncbi:hypothetical protein [Streptomyces sp. NBC_01262]|uniref:hypothetical protein n=1 Tax=Streptomyces sp. NBC_01262 TaxID=2903803 RepID=UPI002E377B96|nr:hypothetical protein [Streptomyces sp. NBC_01262]
MTEIDERSSTPAQTVAAVLAWGVAILALGFFVFWAVFVIWYVHAAESRWYLWPALYGLGPLAASAVICLVVRATPGVRSLSAAGRLAVLGACAAAAPVALAVAFRGAV